MRVRVSTGAAEMKLHIVREASDPPESLCRRAYCDPDATEMELESLKGFGYACRSCLRSADRLADSD